MYHSSHCTLYIKNLIKCFIGSLSPAVDQLADDEGNDDGYDKNSQSYANCNRHNLFSISTVN